VGETRRSGFKSLRPHSSSGVVPISFQLAARFDSLNPYSLPIPFLKDETK
jgi:hypothetical protein